MKHASVVVPAHDEARVIGRCLDSLRDGDAAGSPQVVVVSNGSTDDTAARARAGGADVVETTVASKAHALNLGDQHSGGRYPRVYLDADIELGPGALGALVAALDDRDTPTIGMPRLSFDTSRSSVLVRSFFRTYLATPYMTDGLVGAGCYAVNAAGRARWAEFPDVIADDLYVQGRFSATERLVVTGVGCTAFAPRDVSSLLKQRTRSYLGNRQLAATGGAGHMASTTSGSTRWLLGSVLRRPWTVLDTSVYVVLNLVARRRAARLSYGAEWLRDASSRS